MCNNTPARITCITFNGIVCASFVLLWLSVNYIKKKSFNDKKSIEACMEVLPDIYIYASDKKGLT